MIWFKIIIGFKANFNKIINKRFEEKPVYEKIGFNIPQNLNKQELFLNFTKQEFI